MILMYRYFMNIKRIVLSNKILYETYFFITGKKLWKRLIDKKIERLQKSDLDWEMNNICSDLVISLTSYGDRINELQYTLFSLIKQTIKPSIVLVWLTEQDFNNVLKNNVLMRFCDFNVEYKITDDLKSYKKLIPALEYFPDKIIVTVDDDIYYDKDCINRLLNEHEKYPEDVIANIGKDVLFSAGVMQSYNMWLYAKRNSSLIGLPIGCGGVLYPPHNFASIVLNKNLFFELTPRGDDLWFWFMTLYNGKKVRILGRKSNKLKYVNIYREYNLTSSTTLNAQNVGENLNDKQIRNIMNYLNLKDQDLQSLVNGEKYDFSKKS